MLTLPNLLTMARIAVIPALVSVIYIDGPITAWIAFALFAAAAVTDYFDGWIARARGQLSDFGRVFDPIADKLLVAAALLMLVAVARAPVIAVGLILLREILISGLREGLAGRIALPVSRLAKWKTASQMVAIGVLLIAPAIPAVGLLHAIGEGVLWFAAGLTCVTGLDYLRATRRHLGGASTVGEDSGQS